MPVKRYLIITVCLLAAAAAFADSPGGYELVASESGDESFVKVLAVSSGGSRQALWDADPMSSGWVFLIDGEVVSPADSDWVREDRLSESGRILTYSNRVYSVEQRISISAEGSHAKAAMRITNNSTDVVEVVPILILDTLLGETTGLPFVLPDGSWVKSETSFEGPAIPEWIKTVRDSSTPDLTITFADRISDVPDSILAANWLRLKQNAGSFEFNAGRNFDYLPFSEKDSALLLRYGSQKLRPGDSAEVNVVFGLDENVPRPEEFDRAVSAAVDAGRENIRLREYTLRQRLREITSTIAEIDAILADEGGLKADAVSGIEKSVGQQERLRAEYENL